MISSLPVFSLGREVWRKQEGQEQDPYSPDLQIGEQFRRVIQVGGREGQLLLTQKLIGPEFDVHMQLFLAVEIKGTSCRLGLVSSECVHLLHYECDLEKHNRLGCHSKVAHKSKKQRVLGQRIMSLLPPFLAV